jgi:hypothetical protein
MGALGGLQVNVVVGSVLIFAYLSWAFRHNMERSKVMLFISELPVLQCLYARSCQWCT